MHYGFDDQIGFVCSVNESIFTIDLSFFGSASCVSTTVAIVIMLASARCQATERDGKLKTSPWCKGPEATERQIEAAEKFYTLCF